VQSQPDEPSAIDNFFIFSLAAARISTDGDWADKGSIQAGDMSKKISPILAVQYIPCGPFYRPKIRGKKNKKKIFLFYFFSPGFLLML
jgi:hypothetical protein